MGIGDWGLGIGDWAQSPSPNPQSPIPNPHFFCKCFFEITKKYLKKNLLYKNSGIFNYQIIMINKIPDKKMIIFFKELEINHLEYQYAYNLDDRVIFKIYPALIKE